MPETILEPVVDEDSQSIPFVQVDHYDDDHEQEDFLRAISDIEEILRLLKDNKVASLDSIKGSLLNIDVIYDYFRNHFPKSEMVSKMKAFLSQEGEKILHLVDSHASNEVVFQELNVLLQYIVTAYKKETNPDYEDNPQVVLEEPNFTIEEFHLPKVDEYYQKLYEAIEKKDSRNENYYRGRIIKELRKNRKLIHTKYEKVAVLNEISKILFSGSSNALQDIRILLSKPEYKDYYDYFSSSFQSLDQFKQKLSLLFQNPNIIQIIFYEYAIKEETNKHGKEIKEHYSREFLDKRANITSLVTVLPKAVGLSIQKLANTILELQEAKTNRKKTSKFLETLKDVGRVLATPVIFCGKFAVNNWYILYKLYHGFVDVKPSVQDNDSLLEENHETEVVAAEPEVVEAEPEAAGEPVESENKVTPHRPHVEKPHIVLWDEDVQENHSSPENQDILLEPKGDRWIQDDTSPYVAPVENPNVEVEVNPEVEVQVNPDAHAEPQPQPEAEPEPSRIEIHVDPVPSDYTPPAEVPVYNPWKFEAVCDPNSESFIVLPSFVIDCFGLRETVDTMNDMAIYHHNPYSDPTNEHGHHSGKF